MLSFTIGKNSITVFIDGQINTIDTSHFNHQHLLDELKKPAAERDLDAIRSFVTFKKMIERLTAGRVKVMDDEVQFDGTKVDNYMTGRMIEILESGVDVTPWARFMDFLMDNPAKYAIDELYEWLEKGKMPITEDGHFLAFKKIRSDYTDVHTGKFDNSPGTIVEMDRALCDPNRHNHCSTGFHFASVGYLRSFGGQRVVVVKINPRDVTSIPSDYGYTKGRCCRYEVVAELANESAAHHEVWKKPIADIENPQEFPSSIISMLAPPKIAEEAPVEAASDPVIAEDLVTGDGSGEALPPISEPVAAVASLGAAIQRVGQTLVVTPDLRSMIQNAAANVAKDSVNKPKPAPKAKASKGPEFTTASGTVYTVKQVKKAVADASSNREAARVLGVGESTLRGWIKRL